MVAIHECQTSVVIRVHVSGEDVTRRSWIDSEGLLIEACERVAPFREVEEVASRVGEGEMKAEVEVEVCSLFGSGSADWILE